MPWATLPACFQRVQIRHIEVDGRKLIKIKKLLEGEYAIIRPKFGRWMIPASTVFELIPIDEGGCPPLPSNTQDNLRMGEPVFYWF